MLHAFDWSLQLVSIYDVLSHFLCQGILFTTDAIKNVDGTTSKPTLYTAKVLHHNAEIFTNLCLKKHEFLQYD